MPASGAVLLSGSLSGASPGCSATAGTSPKGASRAGDSATPGSRPGLPVQTAASTAASNKRKNNFFMERQKDLTASAQSDAVMMFARSICFFIPMGRTLSRRPTGPKRAFLDLFNQAFYGIKNRLRVLYFAVLNGSPPARRGRRHAAVPKLENHAERCPTP